MKKYLFFLSIAVVYNLHGLKAQEHNTAYGHYALLKSSGDFNSAFGYLALYLSYTGSNNTAIGYNSLTSTSGIVIRPLVVLP